MSVGLPFSGDGEMAGRLAAHEWASTPLGPVDAWSPGLRTSVAIMLRTHHPMLLGWGEHLVMLYNDAYIPALGAKHPHAVGGLLREQYADRWDEIGGIHESVLAGGPSTWEEDRPVLIERGDGHEEAFFTSSYSHVPDEGGIGGVLAVLTVTTAKVVAARRLSLLNQLAVVAQGATGPDQAMAAAFEVLAAAPDELRAGALYARRGSSAAGAGPLTQTNVFGEPDAALLPRLVDAPDHPVTRAWALQRSVHRNLPHPWAALPVRGQGEVEAVLVLVPHPLRPYDEHHERFVGLVAEKIGEILALATARARERAQLESLAALDAAKTDFLSNVSHGLRTPLSLLLGPLEDVLNGDATSLEHGDAQLMHASAQRLLRMVNALLDVAHVTSDGLPVDPRPTDLTRLTDDLLHPFADAATRAGLSLQSELDAGLGTVLVDPDLWETIVLNLVANAIAFTDEGSVRVVLTERGEHLVLRVSDTGPGLPESEVGQILDRSHGTPGEASRTARRSGVGLTLVAEAVRSMGGTVRADSSADVGTTIEVVVPMVPAAPDSASTRSPGLDAARAIAEQAAVSNATASTTAAGPAPGIARPDGRSRADQPVILVVEDDPALRSRVARMLGELGQVLTAYDGQVALETLRSTKVDLVVSDVVMPRLDGPGLLEQIRDDDALRSTPVVFLSARAGAGAAAGTVEAGADDYVVKPFTAGELLARCRTTLELADYRARTAASRMRGALLAGVSHDMQTPLAVLTTSLGLLGEPDLAASDRNRIAGRARVRASQLSRLVTQFLDWSRMSMNEPLPIRIELVDVAALVRDIASEHDGVRVTGEELDSEIRCDRQRTEQVLHNLVENAKRVARSSVEIRHGIEGDHLTVRVIDDGPGVDPEVQARLFEAFGPSTAQKGSGLGLHVSREAARAQGGELVLESTGPEGAVFMLSLPRRRAD